MVWVPCGHGVQVRRARDGARLGRRAMGASEPFGPAAADVPPRRLQEPGGPGCLAQHDVQEHHHRQGSGPDLPLPCRPADGRAVLVWVGARVRCFAAPACHPSAFSLESFAPRNRTILLCCRVATVGRRVATVGRHVATLPLWDATLPSCPLHACGRRPTSASQQSFLFLGAPPWGTTQPKPDSCGLFWTRGLAG
jgi:hypothetical protein